jgi:hypothetical protein
MSARVEAVASVLHWTAPWDLEGYQPPATYEGAKELAEAILAALDELEGPPNPDPADIPF